MTQPDNTSPDNPLPEGEPEQTDNGTYPEDGEQDVSQDPNVDYSVQAPEPTA